MSVDDYSDDDSNPDRPPIGRSFQADLQRVGEVMRAGLRSAGEDETMDREELQRRAMERAQDLEDDLEADGVPDEEAIVMCWLFLLGFAE